MKTRYREVDTNIFEKTWRNKRGAQSKTLYFKIMVRGVSVHRNAYDPDNPHIVPKNLTEARLFRDKIRIRLAAGLPAMGGANPPQQGGDVLFKDFVDQVYLPFSLTNHRTHRGYKYYARILNAFFGSRPLASISPFDVERFQAEQMKRKRERGEGRLSGNTIRLYLACLSSIFQKSILEGIRADNPCSEVGAPELKPKGKRRLQEGEEERLLSMACPALRSIIILMLETGARPYELLRLAREDITWDAEPQERTITLTSYKSKKRRKLSAEAKRRDIPITERA